MLADRAGGAVSVHLPAWDESVASCRPTVVDQLNTSISETFSVSV